jgi:hypothetical protein
MCVCATQGSNCTRVTEEPKMHLDKKSRDTLYFTYAWRYIFPTNFDLRLVFTFVKFANISSFAHASLCKVV